MGYKWVSFDWLWRRVHRLALVLQGLAQKTPEKAMRVMLCGPNSLQWLVTDLACVVAGAVAVVAHYPSKYTRLVLS